MITFTAEELAILSQAFHDDVKEDDDPLIKAKDLIFVSQPNLPIDSTIVSIVEHSTITTNNLKKGYISVPK